MSSPAPEVPASLQTALAQTRERLAAGGIEEASLEAELLLRQALRGDDEALPDRAAIFRRFRDDLDATILERLELLLLRRLAHEPAAYITGRREFWGLDFEVGPGVLIPRPETELLVSKALAAVRKLVSPPPSGGTDSTAPRPLRPGSGHASTGSGRTDAVFSRPFRLDAHSARPEALDGRARARLTPIIVDAGTGSGAIAVAIATEAPAATIYATDVSGEALSIAASNARRCGVERRIAFKRGSLLEPIACYVDLVVANLPYVTSADWGKLPPELRDHEPRLALDGGEDGLDVIRALLHQAPRYLRPGGAVCLEFGLGQRDAVVECAARALPEASIEVYDDFAGIPRVIVARLPQRPVEP